MKFKIFGGLDCPDSVLAQISVVSSLHQMQISKLVDHCTAAVISVGDYCTAVPATSSSGSSSSSDATSRLKELAASTVAFCEQEEFKSVSPLLLAQALTAMHTMITNIVRFRVAADAAIDDLTMLGLDPTVAEIIASGAHASFSALQSALRATIPLCNRVKSAAASHVVRAAATYDESSHAIVESEEEGGTTSAIRLTMRLLTESHEDGGGGVASAEQQHKDVVVDMSVEKAMALLVELVAARTALVEQNSVASA